MKKVVIDINIFMDFLFKREGHEKVAEIFKHCIKGNVIGFSCAHEITTLNYFLSKSNKNKVKIKKTISGIMKRFKVIAINEDILNKALFSEIDDFEDAVIEISSKENNAEYILTRNTKDFKKSIIKPITPEELLAILKNNTSKENKSI
ncbi:MAG: PIN domain-containing protein [Spirochaetaceae bacterium]|jgi:predicted nucleic acid-binding protein|nr:PIN domain-containing protein [Spirochaetaceae bacterium]